CVRSESHATQALVFVHGFGGDSYSTWTYCQYLTDRPEFAAAFESVDLYFYDYASTRDIVAVSADELGIFVDKAVDSARKYQAIRFVAHSIGAVVVRQLILDRVKYCKQNNVRPWPLVLESNPLF